MPDARGVQDPGGGGGAATHAADVTAPAHGAARDRLPPVGPGRRHLPLLLMPPLLPLAARPARARPPGEIRFRIMREGSAIGTHRVLFSEGAGAGGELVARTEVDVQVRLAGFTVFRLAHRFAETWAGGRLRLATSRRERNGKATEMVARQVPGGGGILAQGPEGEFRLPPDAAPLSWWDPAMFNRPLFDSDTGRPLQLRWTRQALPGGAVRWRASDAEESEGTYAADGTWLDWRTRGEDGSLVTYERV